MKTNPLTLALVATLTVTLFLGSALADNHKTAEEEAVLLRKIRRSKITMGSPTDSPPGGGDPGPDDRGEEV